MNYKIVDAQCHQYEDGEQELEYIIDITLTESELSEYESKEEWANNNMAFFFDIFDVNYDIERIEWINDRLHVYVNAGVCNLNYNAMMQGVIDGIIRSEK